MLAPLRCVGALWRLLGLAVDSVGKFGPALSHIVELLPRLLFGCICAVHAGAVVAAVGENAPRCCAAVFVDGQSDAVHVVPLICCR